MQNDVDDLRLQKDVSSFSSFFKTKVSLTQDNVVQDKNHTEMSGNIRENETVPTTEETIDDVKTERDTKDVNEMNNNNITKIVDSEQNISKHQTLSVKDSILNNSYPYVRSTDKHTANNLSEQPNIRIQEEKHNLENDVTKENNLNGNYEEKLIDTQHKETTYQGNLPESFSFKDQDDAFEDDQVEQERDSNENVQLPTQSLPLIEQVNLTRSTPNHFRISPNFIAEGHDKTSTSEFSSPSTNKKDGDVKNIQNNSYHADQMPEFKQKEPNKTKLNDEKIFVENRNEIISTAEKNLEKVTDHLSTTKQECNGQTQDSVHVTGETEIPRRKTFDIVISDSCKDQRQDMQTSMQESVIVDDKGLENLKAKNLESDSEKVKDPKELSKQNELPAENLYFTGRLPSLLSRDETIQLTSRGTIGERETSLSISKTEGYKVPSKLSQQNDERDICGEKENVNLPLDSKMYDVKDDERKPTVVKALTPTKQVHELLQEIKDTPQSVISASKVEKYRPKSNIHNVEYDMASQRFPDAILSVQEANEPPRTLKDFESGTVNMTLDDIKTVASKVLGTNYAEEHNSRFDDIPHIKEIDNYVRQNNKLECETRNSISRNLDKSIKAVVNSEDVNYENKELPHPEMIRLSDESDMVLKVSNETNTANNNDTISKTENEKFSNESEPLPATKNENILSPSPSKMLFDNGITNNEIQIENQQLDQTSIESKLHDSQNIKSSSTENDLKAIIASAKVAISTGTETSMESQFDNRKTETSSFTLRGDSLLQYKRGTATSNTTSKGKWSTTTQSDDHEALSSLICSNCLHVDTYIHLAGFCTDCQQYLCSACISVHIANSGTGHHEIVPSYCKNELAINKYVQATGYCVDCSMFLCMKCVVQHTGFRANRHHKIIQSSFVSKSSDRKNEVNEFLNNIQDKIEHESSEKSLNARKDRKKKKKLLSDLDNSNPYSSPFKHVPESLYPGPNKKVTASYTKHPKWAYSSIPNLPYLVQPKPIPDRVYHAAGHHRPVMIYTKPKPGFDAMATKFKSLRARYKVNDSPRTARRREQSLFTARPTKTRNVPSLRDMESVKSHTSGGRSVRPGKVQNATPAKKEVEFINEHCLSIPIPRGEKRTDILAMSILMDGRLALLDKNNNNVKLFNKSFHCIAALQFQNRLIDICASNLCPTDVYAATPKNIYEISALKGMDISRNIKVEIKRIEGMVIWKYGLAVISKKTNITWELRLLDYRGNLKSKLEIFNPLTLNIASSKLHNMTSSREGKFISIADTKNSCIITVDVTTRVVVHETMLEEGTHPTYLASDGEGNHNIYVSCDSKVFQISRKGKVVGVLIDKAKEHCEIGSIIYNKLNNRLYIKTGKDLISEYQVYF